MTDAVVILDKPSGITSHGAVSAVRRLLGIRKVGHAGTLDPMATGVLVLGIGRATRLLGHLMLSDKRYLATIRLGESSTTDDAEGEVQKVASATHLSATELDRTLDCFRGEIDQVPSSVSAIKVQGKRAYQLVREGESVRLAARRVTIDRLDLLDLRHHQECLEIDIDVECSSGTYIRAIARDLGQALGVGGHLRALRRTRVGGFSLDDAVELGTEAPPTMSMADAARRSFPVVELTAQESQRVKFGKSLQRQFTEPVTAVCSPEGKLLGLYRPVGGQALPIAVLVGPEG